MGDGLVVMLSVGFCEVAGGVGGWVLADSEGPRNMVAISRPRSSWFGDMDVRIFSCSLPRAGPAGSWSYEGSERRLGRGVREVGFPVKEEPIERSCLMLSVCSNGCGLFRMWRRLGWRSCMEACWACSRWSVRALVRLLLFGNVRRCAHTGGIYAGGCNMHCGTEWPYVEDVRAVGWNLTAKSFFIHAHYVWN